MHILALVPGGIADQLLFFPTLETLKRTYPQGVIDVVTEPRGLPAYQICATVHKATAFDFEDRNSLADWSNLFGIIREQEYEAVLTVKGGWPVGLLLWLCGIPSRIGYVDSGVGWLTQEVPFKSKQYRAQAYHDLLQGLRLSAPCPELKVNLPRKEMEWAEAEQVRLGIQGQGYILVHPDASTHAYPIDRWVSILKNIRDRQSDLPLLIVKTGADPALFSALTEAKVSYQAVAPDNLGRLAALIGGANLMICPEGDSLQVAVAVQTFTIALFNATKPELLLPQNDKFMGLQASTGRIADIAPQQVLDKIFGGS